MVGRFLLGYHPNLARMGVWLSRPGIDVQAATLEAHFLLSTDYKNEQVLMTGVVSMGPGVGVFVAFPLTLPNPPYVSYNDTVDGSVNYYPFRSDLRQSQRVQVNVATNGMSVINHGAHGVAIHYRVLCRALGS